MAAPGAVPGKDAQMIVVYCEIGIRADLARAALVKAGYTNVFQLNGDMAGWRMDGLPLERLKKNRSRRGVANGAWPGKAKQE
jgi:rhodanese-related sulfurtransferase